MNYTAVCVTSFLFTFSLIVSVLAYAERETLHSYFLRRRMKRAGQDPDRKLSRQEVRHLQARLAKQQMRAARSDVHAIRRGTYRPKPHVPKF